VGLLVGDEVGLGVAEDELVIVGTVVGLACGEIVMLAFVGF